jgi:hypothetical protein
MKSIKFASILVFLIIFSLSCAFVTQPLSGGGGPKNFTAALTAPDVVMLKWDAVDGASGYILELSIDNGESFSIVALPPERTSYEDLTAPEKRNLIYQVQVVTESGTGGKNQVSIETDERQPNPMTVTPEYDEENAVATTVGAQGGEVSLVDSKEVQYTLSIPAGALSSDTEIRMTAVNSIQDWPMESEAIGAVRLEPEGLILNDVAILTIGFPVDLNPGLTTVGFAFEADGQEFHLQPTDQEKSLTNILPSEGGHLARPVFQKPKNIVRMPVVELKVGGLGQTDHQSVSKFVKDHAPTDSGAALEQKWAAEAIADDELAPIKGFSDPALEEAYQIGNTFQYAENCKELNSLIVLFQKWRFSSSYQGLSDDKRRDYTSFIWDELTDKAKEILENVAAECEKSKEPGGSTAAESSCAKALLEKIMNPPSGTVSNFNLDLKNKLGNKLSDKELQDIKDKLDKCKAAAYQIVGGAGDFQTNTAVCNIMAPFTLTGGGFAVNFSGGLSGTYTYTGPFAASGGQRYSIYLPDGLGKPGTMTGSGTGCVTTPKGIVCKGGTEQYDLTPIECK